MDARVTHRLRAGQGLIRAYHGHATGMTVTDPDVPDPLNDPRTTLDEPGAVAEGAGPAASAGGPGADLASPGDAPTATGEDDLTAGRTEADDAGGGDVTGGPFSEAPGA